MKTQLRISKSDREKVLHKYDCRCGYCGKELTLKSLQVDHIKPVYRTHTDAQLGDYKRGENTMDNYMPSCARCNRRKSIWTIEQFREQIRQVTAQFRKYNPSYMLAVDYGMIKETNEEVLFYFEKRELENIKQNFSITTDVAYTLPTPRIVHPVTPKNL